VAADHRQELPLRSPYTATLDIAKKSKRQTDYDLQIQIYVFHFQNRHRKLDAVECYALDDEIMRSHL